MKRLIILSLVFLMTGCVSPSDLKSSKPILSAVTSKNPKQYALCVLPYWQDARSEAAMSETESGYRLVVGAFKLTDELLEISSTSSGSKVDFFQRVAWIPGLGRAAIESSVIKCL